MELHLGKLVDTVRERAGMTEAEMARRSNYSANNVNKFKKRPHFYTDALDALCLVLRYNFYEDKAREMASKLSPGVSEPVAPYEKDAVRAELIEAKKQLQICSEKLLMVNDLVKSKDEIIKLLRGRQQLENNGAS